MESEAKTRNVIDMAITVAAMTRVFESESKERIAEQLGRSLAKLQRVTGQGAYEALHLDFCTWFENHIWRAARKRKGKVIRKRRPASYGHGAKIFDIAAKVYVYYCLMPNAESAVRLTPLLHGAIDTPILKYLKQKDGEKRLARATSIATIGKQEYEVLQGLIAEDAKKNHRSTIEHEDVLWWKLNRKARPHS
jgi:hypothetical protein